MNILFMGTPEFAVPCLDILFKNGHNICGVITQPDKPKGRGHKLAPPPVKEYAVENNMEVYQPTTLKNNEILPLLKELNPDIIIVVAYGKILPEYVLAFPKYGCINVHASLLPKYRGAAPIQWAVINGEKISGITTMYMEKGLDTGDMILRAEVAIDPEETYGSLHDKLSPLGAELLLETVKRIEAGTAPREKQDDALSNYAPMISKETGHIDWSMSADDILNLIRGTYPFPGSFCEYGEEILKIIHASNGSSTDKPGGCFCVKNNKLEVACGDGNTILIDEIQFKGGKRMSVASYLNGHEIDETIILK